MLAQICDPHVMSVSSLLEPSFTTIRGRKWTAPGIQWKVCPCFKSKVCENAPNFVVLNVPLVHFSTLLSWCLCREYLFKMWWEVCIPADVFLSRGSSRERKVVPKGQNLGGEFSLDSKQKRHRQSLYINSNSTEESIKFSSQLWGVPFCLFVSLLDLKTCLHDNCWDWTN